MEMLLTITMVLLAAVIFLLLFLSIEGLDQILNQ